MQAVWFSASADLALDATRDFWDIGAYKCARALNLDSLLRVALWKPEDSNTMDINHIWLAGTSLSGSMTSNDWRR